MADTLPKIEAATSATPKTEDPPAEIVPATESTVKDSDPKVASESGPQITTGTESKNEAEPKPVVKPDSKTDPKTKVKTGDVAPEIADSSHEVEGKFNVQCGPLLRYIGQSADNAKWRGSILVVTRPTSETPTLRLKRAGGWKAGDIAEEAASGSEDTTTGLTAVKIFSDETHVYFRFDLEIPFQKFEAKWEYTIPNLHFLPGPRKTTSETHSFFVPAENQSMRIMFHSCNGFSVGTEEDEWSGPALWNDVLRQHESAPFHVMIGGGDQIYNDSVRVSGPLKEWTAMHNPVKRQHFPFGQKIRSESDSFYFKNYVRWYSTEPFSTANAQIPQINIWDDHDIIDGFGSYTERLMKCPVFMGIGSIAFKYYMLFQHHTTPPKTTFTTDAPETMKLTDADGPGIDPLQEKDQYYLKEEVDPSWILGAVPGPYMLQRSRSIYARMGKSIAFVGIDARTERTRHTINTKETYDVIFSRLEKELKTANGDIKHLIVLLGVPIAYPRLVWMENILRSPLIGPLKFLNKRFNVASSMFNQFDGAVDILDDLDDHYTARTHKKERNTFVLRLQELSKEYSVRTTILGGDVHLCAIGRFYSKPKLNIPVEADHRYMINLISSAITNKPPPGAVANLLARRNKIHHLTHDCDETLMKIFDKDAGGISRTANSNKVTMPSRNYAILAESTDEEAFVPTVEFLNGNVTNHESPENYGPHHRASTGKGGHSALHAGEHKAGSEHLAAEGAATGKGGVHKHGLAIALRVECDQHDPQGKTQAYGFSIPALETAKA